MIPRCFPYVILWKTASEDRLKPVIEMQHAGPNLIFSAKSFDTNPLRAPAAFWFKSS